MTVFIVRHAMAGHNVAQKNFPGSRPDPLKDYISDYDGAPLIPCGIAQATLTGRRLSSVKMDAILCSPAVRAVMTAAEIARFQQNELPVEIMYDLIECGMDHYKEPQKEIYDTLYSNIRTYSPLSPTGMIPDLQPDEDSWARAKNIVKYLNERFTNDENVLLVTHGSFAYLYLLSALMRIPDSEHEKYHFMLENAGITRLRFTPDGAIMISAVNDTGHLGVFEARDTFTVNG